MKRIINPITQRQVHISDVSKRQLANTVNEQSAKIRALDNKVKSLARTLIAITQEPEAFQFADGTVSVDWAAIEKVKDGTQLKIEVNSGRLTLSVVAPQEQPQIEVPKILVPA